MGIENCKKKQDMHDLKDNYDTYYINVGAVLKKENTLWISVSYESS